MDALMSREHMDVRSDRGDAITIVRLRNLYWFEPLL